MKKLLANLSLRQRISIAVVAALIGFGVYEMVRRQREADFKPLFTGVSAEDAAAIMQKLKETGVEYRLPEGGGSVLAPIVAGFLFKAGYGLPMVATTMSFGALIAAGVLSMLKLQPDRTDVDWATTRTELPGASAAS